MSIFLPVSVVLVACFSWQRSGDRGISDERNTHLQCVRLFDAKKTIRRVMGWVFPSSAIPTYSSISIDVTDNLWSLSVISLWVVVVWSMTNFVDIVIFCLRRKYHGADGELWAYQYREGGDGGIGARGACCASPAYL